MYSIEIQLKTQEGWLEYISPMFNLERVKVVELVLKNNNAIKYTRIVKWYREGFEPSTELSVAGKEE